MSKLKTDHNSGKNVDRAAIPRHTLANLAQLLKDGRYLEILKVLRRRILNTLKFFRSQLYKIFGPIYNQSALFKRRQQKRLHRILAEYYSYHDPGGGQQLRLGLILSEGATLPKSSAFIRLISPLTRTLLSNKASFKIYPENTTAVDVGTRLCIVQRTAFTNEESARQFISNIQSSRIALVFDTDDAFSAIDPSHPEYDTHQERVDAKEMIIQAADQVWVSTKVLADIYQPMNKQISIVENSLDERIWRPKYQYPYTTSGTGPLKLLYMGTATHDADLQMIFPVLDALAKKYPEAFELTIIGVTGHTLERPWLKRTYQPRGKSIYPKFVEWFLKQGPFDIGLSPLVDSDFNRAKSDIKCLDYLAAGMMPLVSDLTPYQNPELDDYIIRVKNDSESWISTLEEIINKPRDFRKRKEKVIPEAQKYIWERRSSKQTAEQLEKLLNELVEVQVK